jgi:hypothetical protein
MVGEGAVKVEGTSSGGVAGGARAGAHRVVGRGKGLLAGRLRKVRATPRVLAAAALLYSYGTISLYLFVASA